MRVKKNLARIVRSFSASVSSETTHRKPFPAYPVDTSPVLNNLRVRFKRTNKAVNVDFRSLVSWLKYGERATHYIHPYPAKLLPQIAHFFLAAHILSRPGDTVLDPFGGSGTVALEAILAGRNALIVDANPLARLISRVKTRPLNHSTLRLKLAEITERWSEIEKPDQATLPEVVNIDHWFLPRIKTELHHLLICIEAEPDLSIREFFLICFSVLVRKVSFADPRLSVPVSVRTSKSKRTRKVRMARLKWLKKCEVFALFQEVATDNIDRMTKFIALKPSGSQARVVGCDAKCLVYSGQSTKQCNRVPNESIQLIVTSPPYGGAQKYIRASSLNLGWLRLAEPSELRPLEEKTIGREHYKKCEYDSLKKTGIRAADVRLEAIYKINPLRAYIAANYLKEMLVALREIVRVLRPGGYLVFVVGNNIVCGKPFLNSKYFIDALKRLGLTIEIKMIDKIKSRGLMTKRNKTASIITREYVFLCRKRVKNG